MPKKASILRTWELTFALIISIVVILPVTADALPLAGTDTFDSSLLHELFIYANTAFPDGYSETLNLSGPTVVVRGDPYDSGSGIMRIDTEIVSMNLTGFSTTLGLLFLTESTTIASLGEVTQLTAGIDYPADSFFDVFFEIHLRWLPLTLVNKEAARLESIINDIPPIGDLYVLNLDVLLYDKTDLGGDPLGYIAAGATHQPVPEPASMLLIGSGLIGLLGFRRKAKC